MEVEGKLLAKPVPVQIANYFNEYFNDKVNKLRIVYLRILITDLIMKN